MKWLCWLSLTAAVFCSGCSDQSPAREGPAESASHAPAAPDTKSASPAQPAARYDRPADAAPGPEGVLGHAMTLLALTRTGDTTYTLQIHDPADNIVDGAGMHRWQAPAATVEARVGQHGWSLPLNDQQVFVTEVILVTPQPPLQPTPESMPDLSQHARPGWRNYCGPTAVANVLYYLAVDHPSAGLLFPAGPGSAADTTADRRIAGIDAPPSAPGSIAELAAASPENGSTPAGLVEALRAACQRSRLPVDVALVSVTAGLTPSDLAQQALESGARGGVAILCVQYQPYHAPPASREQAAEPTNPVSTASSPAEQPRKNSESPPETEAQRAATATATELPAGPTEATAPDRSPDQPSSASAPAPTQPATPPDAPADRFEHSSQSPHPTPPNQRRSAAVEQALLTEIRGVTERARQLSSNRAPTAPESSNAIDLANWLGRWRQTDGDREPDFSVGGYQTNQIVLRVDALQTVRRYGESAKFVETFDYELRDGQLVIRRRSPPLFRDGQRLELSQGVTLIGPDPKPEWRLEASCDGHTLTLDGKTYRRE